MNKLTFQQLLQNGDFRELFVAELGWNKWKSRAELLPILIDNIEYQFYNVAERSGLQVVAVTVDHLPKNALTRRIDAQLRKQAQDYIAIYQLRNSPGHHQWVIPIKNVDKRDLVSIEYEKPSKADFLFSKIQDIEFDPAQRTTIVDVKESVHRAFAVNAEKITKDFYAGFRKEHKAFVKFISGIDDHITEKDNRNKQWYASVMLNRLMFCYFIQKKGFLNGNVNYLRDKLEWCRRERGEDRFFTTFYKGFLTRLFSDGLNSPRHDRDFQQQFGRIPYLNGGMFDSHPIERLYPDIDIADNAFISLFAFFDKWQWHLDTRVTASGKDINPDVLGYIFEQYINDRAQMGAYYTKEDITEYIGRNTILPFLFDKVQHSSNSVGQMFAPGGWVWQKLQASGDRYIFDAVKHGYTPDWRKRIPKEIAIGLDSHEPNLLDRRKDWNTRTTEPFALPTEIWRETIERLQRCEDILGKINRGEISSINDFITYNLNIRQFASDLINAEDASQSFIFNFYNALRSVTILDPTCGSGAFLFAAINILDPLYYDCITRMQNIERKSLDTEKALDEIKSKYRSNIHYFIYKSIILRNLYGVDIMAEATEIAKLRLFLKMVAVVDVQPLAPNLGLDPLPDIDFNICCGNTLVGYANADSVVNDHNGDMFAKLDFEDKVKGEMEIVARAYDEFRRMQMYQDDDMAEFKQAKEALRARLARLNDTLNHHLHNATAPNIPYADWLSTHQPFNWVAEFYDIIHGHGGFDVIIGNPPYVEYSKRNVNYTVVNYQTLKSSNLYSFVFERAFQIGKNKVAFIVQLSSVGTVGMDSLQKFLISNSNNLFYGCFPERPQQLFEGACIALTIIMCDKGRDNCNLYGQGVYRTAGEFRPVLFQSIHAKHIEIGSYLLPNLSLLPKFKSPIEQSIFAKILKEKALSHQLSQSRVSDNCVTYRTAGGRYWKIFLNRPFANESTSNKNKPLIESFNKNIAVAVLNSNLFWLYYVNYFDLYNLKDYMIFAFPFTPNTLINSKLKELGLRLMLSYENKKIENTQFIKSKQQLSIFESFNPALSKPIIDEIDKVLAKHYGFTEEELDFIINYDIKYRMGDELNNEGE